MELEDLLIEQIVSLKLKVLCNDRKIHNVSFFDFIRCEEQSISIKQDKLEKNPKNNKREIEVCIKCNGYSVGIDIENNS